MAKKKMEWYDALAFIVLIIAAIAWGLYGLFSFNLVEELTSGMLTKWVFGIIGAFGVYGAYTFYKIS